MKRCTHPFDGNEFQVIGDFELCGSCQRSFFKEVAEYLPILVEYWVEDHSIPIKRKRPEGAGARKGWPALKDAAIAG